MPRPSLSRLALAALLASLAPSLRAQAEPAGPEGKGFAHRLMFYAGFDKSLEPDFRHGLDSVRGTYAAAPGRVGQGYLSKGEPALYRAELNIARAAGTLAFWVKPPADPAGEEYFRLPNAPFLVRGGGKDGRLVFMTGVALKGEDFRWDYGTNSAYPEIGDKRWIHVAVTWDAASGEKCIYIDGAERARHRTTQLTAEPPTADMRFGAAPGVYDELGIWGRVLTDAEIRRLAREPALIKTAAATLPREVDDNPWILQPEQPKIGYERSLLAPGETFSLKLPVKNLTKTSRRGTMRLRLVDMDEQPVDREQTFSLDLAGGAARVIEASFSTRKLGAFKIEAQVTVDGRTRVRDVASFGVVPEGEPRSNGFFGVHNQNGEPSAKAFRRLGYTMNRVHNMTQFTWWVRMQPERDTWAMERLGPYKELMELGYGHYGQWFGAPYWAVKLPDGAHPPKQKPTDYPKGWVPTDREALADYVRESLRRFPEIKEWEMWNEPYVSMFWSGSPKDYVEMCKVIYAAAKAARPDITIYAQIPASGPWARTAFEHGIADHTDGFAFHWYANASDVHPQGAADVAGNYRALVAKHSKKDPASFPIVQSEGCVRSGTFLRGLEGPDLLPESKRPPLDFVRAAEMSVASRVVMMAKGVKTDYFYIGGGGGSFFLYDVNFAPKPKAIALGQLAWQIDGGKFVRELADLPAGLRAYLFTRLDGRTLAVLWAEDGAAFTIRPDTEAFDLMGNPLPTDRPLRVGTRPVYLQTATPADRFETRLPKDRIVTLDGPVTAAKGGPAAPKRMDAFSIAGEFGEERLLPIDLAPHVNRALADAEPGDGKGGWTDEGPFNDMRMLKPGRHVWLGIPFVLPGEKEGDASVITFAGGNTGGSLRQISIDTQDLKRVRGLAFAHAASWPEGRIAEYVIHYADGETRTLPVINGENIGNWWSDQLEGEDSRTVSFRHPDALSTDSPFRFVRVWYWENERDVPIRGVSVRKFEGRSTFILLGITAAQW